MFANCVHHLCSPFLTIVFPPNWRSFAVDFDWNNWNQNLFLSEITDTFLKKACIAQIRWRWDILQTKRISKYVLFKKSFFARNILRFAKKVVFNGGNFEKNGEEGVFFFRKKNVSIILKDFFYKKTSDCLALKVAVCRRRWNPFVWHYGRTIWKWGSILSNQLLIISLLTSKKNFLWAQKIIMSTSSPVFVSLLVRYSGR